MNENDDELVLFVLFFLGGVKMQHLRFRQTTNHRSDNGGGSLAKNDRPPDNKLGTRQASK